MQVRLMNYASIARLISTALLVLLGTSHTALGQHVYFYTAGERNAVLNELTIVQKEGDTESNYKMTYDWIRIDLSEGSHDLTVESTEFSDPKSVTADLTSEDAVFYEISLRDDSWEVAPQPLEEASINARSDYQQLRRAAEQEERLATHPTTDWTMATVKQHADQSQDAMEGVYKTVDSYGDNLEYTLGLVKNQDAYDLIYLDGGNDSVWSEGDLKGTLEKTGKKGVWSVRWYLSDKSLEEGRYAEYEDNAFVVDVADGITAYYVKEYPTYEED